MFNDNLHLVEKKNNPKFMECLLKLLSLLSYFSSFTLYFLLSLKVHFTRRALRIKKLYFKKFKLRQFRERCKNKYKILTISNIELLFCKSSVKFTTVKVTLELYR